MYHLKIALFININDKDGEMMEEKQNHLTSTKGKQNRIFDCLTEPVFIFSLAAIGVIFVYVWLAVNGNGLQMYTDIVCEYTSIWNSNKTGERNLVYVLILFGSAAMFIYYSLAYSKGKINQLQNLTNKKEKNIRIVFVSLLVATSTIYFVYLGTNPFLISALIVSVIAYGIDKENAYDAFILFISGLYMIAALYRIYVMFGGDNRLDVMTIILLSLLISISVLLALKKNEMLLSRVFLLEQLLIPFTLLVFIASSYKVGEELKVLILPRRIKYLILVLIVIFMLLALYNLKNKWNKKCELNQAFSFGTLVCVMNFNNFSGSGQIISSDLHHPFENIIGFSQIFELRQVPFSEYIPVSGMYSVVQGAFLWLFGKGYYAYYYVTENLFYFAITVFVIWILRKHMSDDKVLLVSLLVPILRYNRVALIIPFMTLLAWPQLIAKKNLWLKIWLLTSLVNGLYYPVSGASVCIGFMPLAIYQSVRFIKEDFNSEKRKPIFWLGWVACIVPILICIPLLLGTLKHMLAMGSQTVYADGISKFGQTLPDNFFAYIQSMGTRLLAYDVSTFLIQAAIVWVSVYLTIRVGKAFLCKKEDRCVDIEAATISVSFGIAIMISFTYTLIRIDINSIYARSAGIIYGSVIMMIIIANRYLNDKKTVYVIVGLAVFLISLVYGESIFSFSSSSKLEPSYTVSEDYVFVEDDYIPRLGQCFVLQSTYDSIVSNYDSTRNLDANVGYMGIGYFGHYYLSNIKGDSVMETETIKGFEAVQETVDLIRREESIINPVDSFTNYYFYNWLLLSGEYVFSPDDGKFYPNNGGLSVEEVRARHKNIGLALDGRDLGRTPTSWGSSMKSLESIMSEIELNSSVSNSGTYTEINFGETVRGEDADFIYIEFADVDTDYEPILFNHSGDVVQEDITWFNEKLMKWDYNRGKTVTIMWLDDEGNQHSMVCALGRGKLLIPLGAGCNWLLNNHEGVSITVSNGEEILNVPNIEEVKLLKVREVE